MPLSDITEASSETSSDEIKEFANKLVEEIALERQGETEKKSDAQIASEQANIPQPSKQTIAEKKTGNNTAVNDGENTGDTETEVQEWIDDEAIAEAAAYGIDEAELADFTSREELDRALKLIDRRAFEAGRKAQEEVQGRNEKGQFVKKEVETEQTQDEPVDDGKYKVSLSPDLYDEEIIGEFTRLRDHYESRLQVLESHFAEARAIQEEQKFDSLVDSLGHADLFGVTGKESPKELERRKALLDEVKTRRLGLERLGRSTEMNESLLKLAARTVFADELDKKKLKQQTSKISRQSQMRMGGSPTKPLPPPSDPREEFDRLYRELERA